MQKFHTPGSDEIARSALQIIPGAAMSNFRKDEDYRPVYMTHGKGARLFDVDGNEYIDYSLSYGPAILGHSNDHIRQALQDQVRRLYTSEVADLEVRAAAKIADHIQSAEMVRFACSGTEANYNALRVARAFTGKDWYVRFNGHYHGGLDNLMGGIVPDARNPIPVAGERPDDLYSQMTHTAGRYSKAFEECYMLEWNDLPALRELLAKRGEDIAAVIMEPTMVNMSGCLPEPGYLAGVRELCTRHGVVLIFDEVLTGFRIGLKGAQGHFGVTPDMTTLAKALGGGVPVSAFCGKLEIMETIASTQVVAGGTYNGHPLAMAAVIATIEELEKNEGAVYDHIRTLGGRLKDGLDELSRKYDQPLLLQGFPAAWTYTFSSKKKLINHQDGLGHGLLMAAKFGGLLKKYGVLTSFRFCTSAAHTQKDVDDALERAEEALKQLDPSTAHEN